MATCVSELHSMCMQAVAGGKDESVSQPLWTPDNDLLFTSDKLGEPGWWNIICLTAQGKVSPGTPERTAARLCLTRYTLFGGRRLMCACAGGIPAAAATYLDLLVCGIIMFMIVVQECCCMAWPCGQSLYSNASALRSETPGAKGCTTWLPAGPAGRETGSRVRGASLGVRHAVLHSASRIKVGPDL